MVPDSRLQLLPAELRALISCIQGQAPEMVDVEWERLARLAGVHGVAPLLHRACRNMRTVPAMLRKGGDPWKGHWRGQRLERALQKARKLWE